MNQLLIRNIRKGDIKSFETLVKSYYNVLFAYALRLLNDSELAKEIVNEAFVRLWNKRKELRKDVDSIKPLLFQIIHNLCINEFKKAENRYNFLELEDDLIGHSELNSLDDIEYKELESEIKKAIEKLPPTRRKVFILSRYHDLKYSEIAAELGISVKTVETQISRSLAQLRILLKDFRK